VCTPASADSSATTASKFPASTAVCSGVWPPPLAVGTAAREVVEVDDTDGDDDDDDEEEEEESADAVANLEEESLADAVADLEEESADAEADLYEQESVPLER
jgi:hypothetical protein